jgi:SNF2 family DNA or RNA helicase
MGSRPTANIGFVLWSDNRNVSIEAAASGVLIRSINPYEFAPAEPLDWKRIKYPLSIRNFGLDLPSLLQNELVELQGEDLFIPTESIYKGLSEEVELLLRVVKHCPLSLHIHSKGTPGLPDFTFSHSWFNGTQCVYPQVMGAFLRFRDRVYLMERGQFSALHSTQAVNEINPEERTRERIFRAIAGLHRDRQFADVILEDFLASTVIVEPTRVGVEIQRETGTSLSLYPVFHGVETDAMRAAFMQQADVEGVYDLPRKEGGRVRVLLSDDIQEVLQDLRKARHISGDKAKRVEESPGVILRDGINKDVLDHSFSPRVIGLTDVSISQLSAQRTEPRGWLDSDEQEQKPKVAEDGADLTEGAELANPEPDRYGPGDQIGRFKPTYRRLAILTNQEAVDFEEGLASTADSDLRFDQPRLPASLATFRIDDHNCRQPFSLKRHQLVGVSWLQQLYSSRATHKGCVLADDMGLGKTLQLLSFLASIIEGKIGPAWPDSGPYDPILVVAPMILFDSWAKEILNSFSPSPFGDVLTLHDAELRRLRRPDGGIGHELKLEESVLDLERIRQHKFVITNYDTVRNFQHSFAKIQWSVVVADEAQEIKSQSITSDALKALKAYFKIASTGTPVENRLLDLWNIVDFLQPGSILGAANDFQREYETPMAGNDDAVRAATAEKLRQLLGYNQPLGRILRRDKKSELPDLPKKEIKKINCDLTNEEIDLYNDLRRRAGLMTERGKQLSLVANDLKKLFNHPRLYKGQEDFSDPDALIAESPKVQSLIKILREISVAKQKALIFCDRRSMQTLLAVVIEHVFKFRPTIINSLTGTGSRGSESSRTGLIREFERKDGFNAIILSPMCAGVGLTITGANHVIHYGRWWNPAVENQATDRAYRIGQNLPVSVYHLIARDTTGRLPRSFDQLLEELLVSKEALATDFLMGGQQCNLAEEDVLAELLRDPAPAFSTANICKEPRDLEVLNPYVFEELCGICLEKQGFSTLASPRSNDGGIDIFAWNKTELKLVQCKHTSQPGRIVLADALEELLGGEQTYQRELSGLRKSRQVNLEVMTNGEMSIRDRLRGRPHELRITRRGDIWKQLVATPVTHADLCEYRGRRCTSRKELIERLRVMA